MQEDLILSLVFKGLAKPAQILGVDYNCFFVNCLIVVLVFMQMKNFLYALLIVPLHLLGWILCKFDKHIYRIIWVKCLIGRTDNKSLWKCQSYEVF